MSERKPFLGSEFVSKSGGNLPGSSDAAYTLYTPKKLTSPVIVAVPHAGRAYPSDVAAKMREPQWSKLRLEDRCADLLGYGVAQATGTALLVAHAPRALIDLNRSPDDVDWGMISGAGVRRAANSHANRRARGGLGLVPRRLPGLGEIWREPLTCESLDARIDGVHRPYHTQLGRMMERLRDEWGASLLIDLHSMPPLKQSRESDVPANLVIGDRFGSSCDDGLVDTALRHLRGGGLHVAHNRPYSGGYVLDHHSAPRRRLFAMQIEVCRSLYLDNLFEEPSGQMDKIINTLSDLVNELAAECIARGKARPFHEPEFRDAAE